MYSKYTQNIGNSDDKIDYYNIFWTLYMKMATLFHVTSNYIAWYIYMMIDCTVKMNTNLMYNLKRERKTKRVYLINR